MALREYARIPLESALVDQNVLGKPHKQAPERLREPYLCGSRRGCLSRAACLRLQGFRADFGGKLEVRCISKNS